MAGSPPTSCEVGDPLEAEARSTEGRSRVPAMAWTATEGRDGASPCAGLRITLRSEPHTPLARAPRLVSGTADAMEDCQELGHGAEEAAWEAIGRAGAAMCERAGGRRRPGKPARCAARAAGVREAECDC